MMRMLRLFIFPVIIFCFFELFLFCFTNFVSCILWVFSIGGLRLNAHRCGSCHPYALCCGLVLKFYYGCICAARFQVTYRKCNFAHFCDEEADFGKSARSLVKHLRADVGEAAFRFLIFGCWPKKLKFPINEKTRGVPPPPEVCGQVAGKCRK